MINNDVARSVMCIKTAQASEITEESVRKNLLRGGL